MIKTVGNHISADDAPWQSVWPADELESVLSCPVCSSTERTVLHENLIDNVFFVAPGKWTLKKCTQCESAYLDPRPSPASIGKAYSNYYTHISSAEQDSTKELHGYRKIRKALGNGYLNKRYGTDRHPSLKCGFWIATLFPRQRQSLDVEFRFLPKHKIGQTVLDVGCGNGDFLRTAISTGWDAYGIDLDAKAVAFAKSRQLNVSVGMIDLFKAKSNCFDAITLSHVIEHLYDPIDALKIAFNLLKPGGTIYIETPNISSSGAKLFKGNWRGIESPRHLVLFNHNAILSLLSEVGFTNISAKSRSNVTHDMFLKSFRILSGLSPYENTIKRLPIFLYLRTLFSTRSMSMQEFIAITAQR